MARREEENQKEIYYDPAGSPFHQDQTRSGRGNRTKSADQQKKPKTSDDQQKRPSSSGKQNQPSSFHQKIHQKASAKVKEVHNVRTHMLGDLRQYLFAANVALSYINVGSSIAWAAPLLYEAKKHGFQGKMFSETEAMIIGSIMFLSMLVTPLPAGIMCDHIGRKKALIIAGLISCVSWLLVVFIRNIVMLYGSRVMAGFFAGAVLTIVPMYIAEIARPKIRGSLAAINPVMLLFGSELTFALGPNVELKVMAITCGVMPHLFLVMMFFLPESPHWLIFKKKYDKAQKNFEWLRGMSLSSNEELRLEYHQMVAHVEKDFPKQGHFRGLYSTRANIRALLVVEVLTGLQRLSGITALTAFSTVTIPDRHIGSLRPVDVITVLGFIWILSTVIALLLIDRVGRVPLLVVSCVGCFLANVSCATWFYVNRANLDAPSTLSAHWFPFAAIMCYGLCYVIGIGSIPAVLQGEMFSTANRAFASAITVMIISATSGFVNIIYFPIARVFGFYINFTFYALICLVALMFTLAAVPETKGKPLHAIQEELAEEF